VKNKVPPPIVLLLAAITMWFLAHSEHAYPIAIPFALPIAVILAAMGIIVSASAIRRFKAVQTTVNPLHPETATSLVDGGIFARTRNPMYVGLFLILLAWGVWLQGLSNAAILLIFVLWLNELQIKPEEAALEKLFGQSYVDYCERVRRWL
jgi:protein-S-isoprenylcysteine O-methyltransferase Ste14